MTGGIREGAKGEPPVAIFYSATARYSPTAPYPCLVEPDCSRFRFAPLHQCVEVDETRNLGSPINFPASHTRYGRGHKSFDDRSYDCSGTISYVLGAGGLIRASMSSTEFRCYGHRGPDKWITIYAREGHTLAVIAGLRLDTTPYDRFTGKWAPRWQTIYRPPRGFDARHPVGL